MVARAGAGPWPQITSVRPRLTSCTMMGTSPPGPLRCGSTTCSVKAVATPASKALPAFSRMAMPTAVAIQCVVATTPNVPSISGLVVKGSGLMLLAMGVHFSCLPRAQLITGKCRRQLQGRHGTRASRRNRRGVDGVAGNAIDKFRRLLSAEIERQGTARIEGAAGRRIDRVRDLALDWNAL